MDRGAWWAIVLNLQMTKPRLCLGKVQCYISDLSDPKTSGMEKKTILPTVLVYPSQHLFKIFKHCFSIFFSVSDFYPVIESHPPTLLSVARSTFLPLYLLLPFSSVNELRKYIWDFSGGPVAGSTLPMQGARVQSLVKELDPTCHN